MSIKNLFLSLFILAFLFPVMLHSMLGPAPFRGRPEVKAIEPEMKAIEYIPQPKLKFILDAWNGNVTSFNTTIKNVNVEDINASMSFEIYGRQYKLTALQAATMGHYTNLSNVVSVVKTLLDRGADPNINLTGPTGLKKFNPVLNALKKLDYQTFFALADKYKRWDLIEESDVPQAIENRDRILKTISTAKASVQASVPSVPTPSPTLLQEISQPTTLEGTLGKLTTSLKALSGALR